MPAPAELLSPIARSDQLVADADHYLRRDLNATEWATVEDLREMLVEVRAVIEGLV